MKNLSKKQIIDYLTAIIKRHIAEEYPMVKFSQLPRRYRQNIANYFMKIYCGTSVTMIFPLYQEF